MKSEHVKTATGSASPSQSSGPPGYDIESIAIKESNIPRGRAAWLGGPTTKIGDRIAPPVADASGLQGIDVSDGNINGQDILNKQLSAEVGATIQYRTCSWPKVCAHESKQSHVPRSGLGVRLLTDWLAWHRLPDCYFLSISAWYVRAQHAPCAVCHLLPPRTSAWRIRSRPSAEATPAGALNL